MDGRRTCTLQTLVANRITSRSRARVLQLSVANVRLFYLPRTRPQRRFNEHIVIVSLGKLRLNRILFKPLGSLGEL